MQAGNSEDATTTKTSWKRHAVTPAFWVIGIALQLAAPLLRDRVPLSDDLLITSMFVPLWVMGQLLLLAGFLRAVRTSTDGWSEGRRLGIGLSALVAFALLDAQVVTVVVEAATGQSGVSLGRDPVRLALMWSTPLTFYVVPALLVVLSWYRRGDLMTFPRVLGLTFVLVGVMNFPFIYWLTHLWDVYYRSQGGDPAASLQVMCALLG